MAIGGKLQSKESGESSGDARCEMSVTRTRVRVAGESADDGGGRVGGGRGAGERAVGAVPLLPRARRLRRAGRAGRPARHAAAAARRARARCDLTLPLLPHFRQFAVHHKVFLTADSFLLNVAISEDYLTYMSCPFENKV
jgi:hypothetical protein